MLYIFIYKDIIDKDVFGPAQCKLYALWDTNWKSVLRIDTLENLSLARFIQSDLKLLFG